MFNLNKKIRKARKGTTIVCVDTHKYYTSVQDAVRDTCTKCKDEVNPFTMRTNLYKKGRFTSKSGLRFCTEPIYNEYKERIKARHQYLQEKGYEIPANLKAELGEQTTQATTVRVENTNTHLTNEQKSLNEALYSFINKEMYNEASTLCNAMKEMFSK